MTGSTAPTASLPLALSFDARYLLGYSAALLCALIWAAYSVLSRAVGEVPTDVVGLFCGATALLAFACHLLFETTVWPTAAEWLAIGALGVGPVGAAFFVWDHGVKRGDIRLLGTASYAAPLLSTLLLVAFNRAQATWVIGAACLLIVGGALLASGVLHRSRHSSQSHS